MKTKIHGWYRLGITLSILWLVSLVGYIGYESQQSEFTKRYFFDSVPAAGAESHRGTNEDPIPIESEFRPSSFIAVLFVPLIVGWLPAIGFVTVRWVRKGFEHEERAQ